MRIATYNVNGINGRLANVLAWLGETVPDIVCLQELRARDEKFPAAAMREADYGAAWHGEKSWNGVGRSGARQRTDAHPPRLSRGSG